MEAKEMFKELGFEMIDKYKGYICYQLILNDSIVLNSIQCIDFRIRDCEISMYSKINDEYGAFNVQNNKIFKAIQKQIQELKEVMIK